MIKLPKTLSRNGWTMNHMVKAMAMVLFGILVTFDAWLDISLFMFSQDEFSHMRLVLPVALWLVWVRRARIRLCYPNGQLFGVLMIALGWCISSLGYYNSIEALWHAGSLLIVLGCFTCIVGIEVIVYFLPAFMILLLLVPIPGVIRTGISIPLQSLVARATQIILEIFGLPVVRSGSLLSVNGTDVTIAEACNGMRMFFALFMVAYCFAFSMPLRQYVRGLILLASPICALFCNILRTVAAVWVYSQYDVGDTFHTISGWVMLLVAFALLVGFLRMLRWALVPVTRFTLVYD